MAGLPGAQVPRGLPLGDGFPPAPRRLKERQGDRERDGGTQAGTAAEAEAEKGQGDVWLQHCGSGSPLSSRGSHHRPRELRVTAWLDRMCPHALGRPVGSPVSARAPAQNMADSDSRPCFLCSGQGGGRVPKDG